MKILLINTFCGIGSTGKIVADIYSVAKKNGHKCKIIYGSGKLNIVPKEDTLKINNDFLIKGHQFLSRFCDGAGKFSYFQTLKAIKYIKEYKPDIINLHNIHGFYINVPLLFKFLKKFNKPVVWTFHDCWPFTGHCAYFDLTNCNQWKTECKTCSQKMRYYPNTYVNLCNKNFKEKKELFNSINNLHIVTCSKWLGDCVRESFLKNYPIQVINNGIDLTLFKPVKNEIREKYNIEYNKKIILSVAQDWVKRKGLSDMIDLSKLLNDNYQIIMIGCNQNEIEYINKNGKNIIALNRTNSQKELVEFYSASDIFVIPSHSDNFPTVELEALACGLPIVTYNVGGCPEVIDEKVGRVAKEEKPEALVSCIEEALKLNKQDCLEKSKQYDKNLKFQEYMNLFKEIYHKTKV